MYHTIVIWHTLQHFHNHELFHMPALLYWSDHQLHKLLHIVPEGSKRLHAPQYYQIYSWKENIRSINGCVQPWTHALSPCDHETTNHETKLITSRVYNSILLITQYYMPTSTRSITLNSILAGVQAWICSLEGLTSERSKLCKDKDNSGVTDVQLRQKNWVS